MDGARESCMEYAEWHWFWMHKHRQTLNCPPCLSHCLSWVHGCHFLAVRLMRTAKRSRLATDWEGANLPATRTTTGCASLRPSVQSGLLVNYSQANNYLSVFLWGSEHIGAHCSATACAMARGIDETNESKLDGSGRRIVRCKPPAFFGKPSMIR
jgi:hypothetical protein